MAAHQSSLPGVPTAFTQRSENKFPVFMRNCEGRQEAIRKETIT